MIRKLFSFAFIKPYAEYGPLFLRLLIGAELIRGSQDNILSYARMLELANFLEVRGVPFPLSGAFVSAYAQFLCGLLFILGLWTRQAGAVIVVHVLFALLLAYRGAPWQASYPVFVLLAAALFFLFHGAGKLSLDDRLERR
ncbi:MAG TPA: DoxX family protein [Thermoanaerobaculia bacterium]